MRKVFCHIYIVLVTLICFSGNGHALEFEAGQYFFDNSNIHYSNIKFATFDTVAVAVHVYDLTTASNNDWHQLTLDEPINCDLYSFVECDIPSGLYAATVDQFLDSLTTHHTQLTMWHEMNPLTHPHNPGYVYCPIMNDEVSDGYWRTQESYNATASGSLPIIYISTYDGLPIVSEDKYMDASLWLDNCGFEDIQPIGSEDVPAEIRIKGRGNYTWRAFYKKPYKIKFAKKLSPLGLDNSKHFILLPHADDMSGYLRDESGFEMSRLLGMEYTPLQKPVEVVLNGDYIGLYFLCEMIRVEQGRVDVLEQQDNDMNPYNVSGGWLLELSQNDNIIVRRFENNDKNGLFYKFGSHSPANVSQVQIDYISKFISQTDSCIFVNNKADRGWENYIDVPSLARYYVINEVLSNIESFCRSMFVYKDWGDEEKLKFGPVWDFGNSFTYAGTDDFIYNYQTQFTFLWLRELLKFPRFKVAILSVWNMFKEQNILNQVLEHDQQLMASIETAKQYDKVRWPYYSDIWSDASERFLDLIASKAAWLDQQWSVTTGDVNCDGAVNASDITTIYDYLLNGDDSFFVTSDVNGDGYVNSSDITALYDTILGN